MDPSCFSATGVIDVFVTGGTPPYSYQWSNGATTEDLIGVVAGYYELTVTDAVSAQATDGWTLVSVPLSSAASAQDGHASCVGSMSGRVQVIEWGINGTPPYSYSPPPDGFDPQGDPYFEFFGTPPGSEVQIQVTDALGCTGVLTEYIIAPQLSGGPQMTVTGIQGSCSNGSGGAAMVGNVYDGTFFGGPDYVLLDEAQFAVASGFNAGNTISFTGLAPGDYQFVRDWDPSGVYMAYSCNGIFFDQVGFTIPDLGPVCGAVSGSVFIDHDADCTQDAVDIPVPFQVLEILPGPVHTITNSAGVFSIDLPDGSYILGQTDPTLVQLCPVSQPVPFTIASNQIEVHLADSSTQPLDLMVDLDPGPMRPGFDGAYWGEVRNLSLQLTGTVSVTLTLDPVLDFLGAAPAPTSVTGNVITWDLTEIAPLSDFDLSVQVHVPTTTPIGTPLSTTLSATCSVAETDISNNTVAVVQQVTGSYDPNDKTARTSSGSSDDLYYIDQDEWIDYVIRFQNTGTASAINVVITDTLPVELDMATFEQGVASHPFDIRFKADRVVEWSFENINLPDSGANEAASHGLVSFRIRPQLPLLAGTVIENTANIYFDFNPPVITEPSVLVAEVSTEVAEGPDPFPLLWPNPAEGALFLSMDVGSLQAFMILDPVGRVVKRGTLRPGGTSVIDISGLSAGGYLLRTSTGERTVQRAFIVR